MRGVRKASVMRKVNVEVTATVKVANPDFDKTAPKGKDNPEMIEELFGTSREEEFPDTLDEYIETRGEAGTYSLAYNSDYNEKREKLRADLLETVNPDAGKKRAKAKFVQVG